MQEQSNRKVLSSEPVDLEEDFLRKMKIKRLEKKDVEHKRLTEADRIRDWKEIFQLNIAENFRLHIIPRLNEKLTSEGFFLEFFPTQTAWDSKTDNEYSEFGVNVTDTSGKELKIRVRAAYNSTLVVSARYEGMPLPNKFYMKWTPARVKQMWQDFDIEMQFSEFMKNHERHFKPYFYTCMGYWQDTYERGKLDDWYKPF